MKFILKGLFFSEDPSFSKSTFRHLLAKPSAPIIMSIYVNVFMYSAYTYNYVCVCECLYSVRETHSIGATLSIDFLNVTSLNYFIKFEGVMSVDFTSISWYTRWIWNVYRNIDWEVKPDKIKHVRFTLALILFTYRYYFHYTCLSKKWHN